MQITIDKEFKDLIPPLSDEEYEQLETNLIGDGIREPLSVWNGILIDGHHRYEIAISNNLPFEVKEYHFGSREEALRWVVNNQLGRRNMSQFERTRLALKLKDTIQTANTRKTIAEMADVSEDTVRKVEIIEREAPELRQAVSDGMSINKAYMRVRPPKVTDMNVTRLIGDFDKDYCADVEADCDRLYDRLKDMAFDANAKSPVLNHRQSGALQACIKYISEKSYELAFVEIIKILDSTQTETSPTAIVTAKALLECLKSAI